MRWETSEALKTLHTHTTVPADKKNSTNIWKWLNLSVFTWRPPGLWICINWAETTTVTKKWGNQRAEGGRTFVFRFFISVTRERRETISNQQFFPFENVFSKCETFLNWNKNMWFTYFWLEMPKHAQTSNRLNPKGLNKRGSTKHQDPTWRSMWEQSVHMNATQRRSEQVMWPGASCTSWRRTRGGPITRPDPRIWCWGP